MKYCRLVIFKDSQNKYCRLVIFKDSQIKYCRLVIFKGFPLEIKFSRCISIGLVGYPVLLIWRVRILTLIINRFGFILYNPMLLFDKELIPRLPRVCTMYLLLSMYYVCITKYVLCVYYVCTTKYVLCMYY